MTQPPKEQRNRKIWVVCSMPCRAWRRWWRPPQWWTCWSCRGTAATSSRSRWSVSSWDGVGCTAHQSLRCWSPPGSVVRKRRRFKTSKNLILSRLLPRARRVFTKKLTWKGILSIKLKRKKIIFAGVLKVIDENSRIRSGSVSQRYGSEDPNPPP